MQTISKERNQKRIVIINTGLEGSTGKIVQQLRKVAEEAGHEVWTATSYQRKAVRSNVKRDAKDIVIGDFLSLYSHLFLGHLTGMSGIFSYLATKRFLKKLDTIDPDVIHLHNLHDSYINLPLMFQYIKNKKLRCIWTFHDCWPMTGRCPYFDLVGCQRWKTGCGNCPYPQERYPKASMDSTAKMWRLKKSWFTGIDDLLIVTPSHWLADLVKESFLAEYMVKVIHNGIDLNVFKPTKNDFREKYGMRNKKIILSVAFGWGDRKGYGDCLKLAEYLGDDYRLVLVGVSKEQIANLPKNVLGIERTNSQKELAAIYSASDVFINTTYEDNYPTVNLEARACGLPVITYKTGGSPESAGADAVVVEVGDIQGLKDAIEETLKVKKRQLEDSDISSGARFAEYVELYNSMNVRGGYSLLEKNMVV